MNKQTAPRGTRTAGQNPHRDTLRRQQLTLWQVPDTYLSKPTDKDLIKLNMLNIPRSASVGSRGTSDHAHGDDAHGDHATGGVDATCRVTT